MLERGIEIGRQLTRQKGAVRQVLVVDDDYQVANHLAESLKSYDFIVTHAASGTEALALCRSNNYDVMVIDRMMPGMGGLTLIAHLRRAEVYAPVLVLSSLGDVDDRVSGLRAGGDDYLTKPYAFSEVAARLDALLRRSSAEPITTLVVGSLRLDFMERTASRLGRPLNLLAREFRLLEYMARSPGCVLTRGMLLRDVWKFRSDGNPNLVDVHMSKLRRKLDAPGEAAMIVSVRGAGFIFQVV